MTKQPASPPGPPSSTAFNANHARTYAEGAARQVPGLAGLHRMTSMLLAERVPEHGRILVLGAGGGLELKALADDHAGWSFAGIDPSADMLRSAKHLTAQHAARIALHEGYIDTAPKGPFDGAVCLLTLHFVPREQRFETLLQLHARLLPGAPLVLAHISFPQTEPERSQWIARHVGFADTAPANVEQAKQAIASKLCILSPEDDEAMLRETGFSDVTLFYAGLTIRGWVSYA